MLGRMMVIDSDVSSRFALKARLGAANHRVLTAASVAEALPLATDVSAVLVRNVASSALAADIAALKRRVSVPVIAICDSLQRQDAFRAGAEYVLDSACHDSVLRARLRCWLAPAGGLGWGFAEPAAEFVPPDQIALLTGDAALSSEWRRAVKAATGQGLAVLTQSSLTERMPMSLAAVLVDGGMTGEGLQNMADLRARLAAEGRGTALAFLQRHPGSDQETRALEIGAAEVLPADLSADRHRAELAARLGNLLRRGLEGERRHSDARLARRLAALDPLTGLINRRQITAELAAAESSDHGFGILMIDIDCFKTINDQHGHAAGDAVLTAVARTLSKEVAGMGLVARYGGEEFLVLLPSAYEAEAVSLAERIRHRVSAQPVPADGLTGPTQVSVSVSVGVAVSDQVSHADGQLVQKVLRKADGALLAAKAAGRNLVMMSKQMHAA
ncbi:GGDEF domain-containing protein [Paracoccus albus]|uniref:GGDEF domain-containing protein n=1 Tax=Paracoccus albus TaxID=3017784 RepID=UPI0022F09A0F|nr:GGDEF domain-containing protein [Paracoccus albus]WBU59136.1 GGDEF domain-containing protein [Paracoccus albus]